MKRTFCDICGKEIVKPNETWKYKLVSNTDNTRLSFDEVLEDVCEECATVIHCCVRMMKECKWKPDFHEALKSDNIVIRHISEYMVSEFENL